MGIRLKIIWDHDPQVLIFSKLSESVIFYKTVFNGLRVVQTHAIFLKSMSERGGSHTRTILKLNELIFNRFWVDLEIQFLSRSMSDPPLSDIDFKNKMDWV